MIEVTAKNPEAILFVGSGLAADEPWEIAQITGSTGAVALTDAQGVALPYPIAMVPFTEESSWLSPPLVFPTGGKFVARFRNTITGELVRKPVMVLSPVSSARTGEGAPIDGAYATVNELIRRFGALELVQLADRSPEQLVSAEMLTTAAQGGDLSGWTEDEQAATAAAIDVIECAIVDASGEIDQYLVGRYQLPLTAIPKNLTRYCCDMTRFNLEPRGARAETQERHKQALDWLRKDVATGKGHLGPAATSSAELPRTMDTYVGTSSKSTFSADALKGWQVE